MSTTLEDWMVATPEIACLRFRGHPSPSTQRRRARVLPPETRRDPRHRRPRAGGPGSRNPQPLSPAAWLSSIRADSAPERGDALSRKNSRVAAECCTSGRRPSGGEVGQSVARVHSGARVDGPVSRSSHEIGAVGLLRRLGDSRYCILAEPRSGIRVPAAEDAGVPRPPHRAVIRRPRARSAPSAYWSRGPWRGGRTLRAWRRR